MGCRVERHYTKHSTPRRRTPGCGDKGWHVTGSVFHALRKLPLLFKTFSVVECIYPRASSTVLRPSTTFLLTTFVYSWVTIVVYTGHI